MNKEITAEDIIKAIDEMFDEEKLRENETFWRGFRYGIMNTQQYISKLSQELERKDNIINELKKWLDIKEEKEIVGTFSDVLDKIKELENDN